MPAKTPAAIVSRLNASVKAVNDPEVRERFIATGLEPISSTSQALEAYVKDDVARWGKVVKASGATVDWVVRRNAPTDRLVSGEGAILR